MNFADADRTPTGPDAEPGSDAETGPDAKPTGPDAETGPDAKPTGPAAEPADPAAAGDATRGPIDHDGRRDELSAALAEVRRRIAEAATAAGRQAAEVRLVAITKTFPAEDAALLADLGVTDLGENRDQEAGEKAAEVRELGPDRRPRWHMVGRLQRNKARSVVGWADVVQSLDSVRLADALSRAARVAMDEGRRSTPLDVLLQASLDDDPERGGCPLDGLAALADHAAGLDGLRLVGVMAVAPLGADPDRAYATLWQASTTLRARHPQASEVSAGMSGDLESAIRQGSTCVRVGTALLGGRRIASP